MPVGCCVRCCLIWSTHDHGKPMPQMWPPTPRTEKGPGARPKRFGRTFAWREHHGHLSEARCFQGNGLPAAGESGIGPWKWQGRRLHTTEHSCGKTPGLRPPPRSTPGGQPRGCQGEGDRMTTPGEQGQLPACVSQGGCPHPWPCGQRGRCLHARPAAPKEDVASSPQKAQRSGGVGGPACE